MFRVDFDWLWRRRLSGRAGMSDAIDIPNAGADANRCIGGLRTLSEPMLSLSRRSAERAEGDAGPCCCWLALLAVPGRVEWGDGDRRPWGDEEPEPDLRRVRKAEEALLVACCSTSTSASLRALWRRRRRRPTERHHLRRRRPRGWNRRRCWPRGPHRLSGWVDRTAEKGFCARVESVWGREGGRRGKKRLCRGGALHLGRLLMKVRRRRLQPRGRAPFGRVRRQHGGTRGGALVCRVLNAVLEALSCLGEGVPIGSVARLRIGEEDPHLSELPLLGREELLEPLSCALLR